ncbi:MAG: 50S ribosomal protein L30e [Halobacteriota archaeon]
MELDIAKSLRTAIRDGKVSIGAKNTLKSIKRGDNQLVVLASNCPQRFHEKIISKSVPTVDLEITTVELGSMCGKPFTISALSIIDAGSSDIMSIREKEISNDRS